MENSGWKKFLKENEILFLIFFVVVFGFLSLTIYNVIRDAKSDFVDAGDGLLIEAPHIVKTYDVNEYKIINKSDQDLAEYYLKQLVEMWDKDPGKLYDLMDQSVKNKYTSREDAINRLNKLKSNRVLQSKVVSYKVDTGVVVILTNENIEFKLVGDGINDYKITFMGQI